MMGLKFKRVVPPWVQYPITSLRVSQGRSMGFVHHMLYVIAGFVMGVQICDFV